MENIKEFSKEKHCWKQITSTKTDKFYFLNLETGETQWNFPNTLDPIPKDWKKYISRKTKPMSSYYINTLSGENTWERPTGTPDIPGKKNLPEGWESKKSKCDNVYYINKSENITTWKLPTDSKIKDKINAKELLREQRGREDKYKSKTYTVEDKLGFINDPQDAQHHPGWKYFPTAEKRKDQSEEDYKKKLKQLEKMLADQKEREEKYYEKVREREQRDIEQREREQTEREQRDIEQREREQKDIEQRERDKYKSKTYTVEDKLGFINDPQDAQYHPGWQYYPTAEKRKDQSEEDYKKKLKQLEKILADQKEREDKYYGEKGNEVVIKVLTYNIAHEISKVNQCKSDKCIKNIGTFIDKKASDCDFIGIQEYSNIPKLTEYSHILNSMSNTHELCPESIKKFGPITFYNQKKYKLDESCNTMKFGFAYPQLGRGIQINFFNDNLCIINVHAGHDTNNSIHTFDKSLDDYLQDKYSKKCKTEFIQKLKTYKIIMFGDMNSNVKDFNHITIDGVKRKLHGRTTTRTCCGDLTKLDGNNNNHGAYDHILSSFSKSFVTKVYEGLEFHSDHNPVICTLTE